MKERQLGPFLARNVRKRLRRVLADGPAAVAAGRDADLHALRISVKRLRYALELCKTFAPEAGEALSALTRLQDALGSLADAGAFARTYADLRGGLEPDDSRRRGIDALAETVRLERQRALGQVRALWSGGAGTTYPERLAASISAALGSLSPNADS
jgi:CHAD domain-containing protein